VLGVMVQTVLFSVEFLQLQFLGKDVDVPVVVQRQVPGFLRTVRSAVFWTRMLSCPLCNDTLWPRQCEYCLEIPRLQFLKSCSARCYAPTGARFSADIPQMQFLGMVVDMPVLMQHDDVIMVVGCGNDAVNVSIESCAILGRILTIGLRRVAVGALNVESQCSWAAVPVLSRH